MNENKEIKEVSQEQESENKESNVSDVGENIGEVVNEVGGAVVGKKKFLTANKVILLLLLLVLATFVIILSTFSRMTSTVTGGDSTTVAKFQFKIRQTEDITSGQGQLVGTDSIDIFKTSAIDTGVADPRTNGNGNLIAPGTEGYFEFEFVNESKVATKVTFDKLGYETSGNGSGKPSVIPLIFYFNNRYYSGLYGLNLNAYDGDSYNSTGEQYIYYHNQGDSTGTNADNPIGGIILSGNIRNLQEAMNAYWTNIPAQANDKEDHTESAAAFLGTDDSNNNIKRMRLAWFWPFEARYKINNTTTEQPKITHQFSDQGTSTSTNNNYYNESYVFDNYNTQFAGGTATATMTPVIRVSQISALGELTENKDTVSYNQRPIKITNAFNPDNWFGRVEPKWKNP